MSGLLLLLLLLLLLEAEAEAGAGIAQAVCSPAGSLRGNLLFAAQR